jgi:hypothetical protein
VLIYLIIKIKLKQIKKCKFMGAGKIFCILGGIIALLATFLFSFAGPFYGIGLYMNLGAIFATGDILFIIMAIVFIIATLSGIFILIGVKSRAMSIIGAIFAIGLGVFFLLAFFGVLPPAVSFYATMFAYAPLVPNIIPLDIMLGTVGLGTYLLVGGGVLGLIGGIMGPDEF